MNKQIMNKQTSFMGISIFKLNSKAAICVKLHDIADKCGIKGMHVHPHAFRHTIVNNLMTCGNKLENVSRFIGHSSVSTTETYYWTTD